MRRFFQTDSAQSSLVDAMMFLSILLVASSLILGLSSSLLQAQDVHSFEDMSSYTKRLLNAVMASTVPNASYVDIDGAEIIRTDISVQNVIIEELLLLQAGVPYENFNGTESYNARIEETVSSLLADQRYGYGLTSIYQDAGFSTGSEPLPSKNTTACTIECLGPELEQISITLRLWRT